MRYVYGISSLLFPPHLFSLTNLTNWNSWCCQSLWIYGFIYCWVTPIFAWHCFPSLIHFALNTELIYIRNNNIYSMHIKSIVELMKFSNTNFGLLKDHVIFSYTLQRLISLILFLLYCIPFHLKNDCAIIVRALILHETWFKYVNWILLYPTSSSLSEWKLHVYLLISLNMI